ncbi:TetR/AcrR family transcriptional regulator [Azotobacter chroococcum]|uniref:TetR family transcriptional regulator n=1 Tax=Azotobacter chroococcum TaxID=353 RepID=A0A4Q9VD40_9GAMM|nr:TetR/AcrR family transcriptional regulator [Azotobacter chroococcum]QQE89891.1 TetR family transcriptional regulator [Azotobacter chroococcum]TBW02082.1 TetR/AcrR family transcriptional regulator [Azotobacter chroococcum]TBW31839.1 TetR/AcrR family transcriptional regulator [Azotobacter chroococcum]TKD47320.1 TetR/AcrR family transcriptional regulator [Azotobacter chroococcum]
MPHSETVERILDAAEQLFAERGFAETSLRLITSKADVNLAAVNYHFGSKNALIEAVFSRVLGPFCACLERELDRRQAAPEPGLSLEELLEITITQVQSARPRSGSDLAIFMRLLGLALSQGQGHLRRYLEDTYGKLFRRYLLLLQVAVPRIPPLELFWRTHFMLGAATFSLSGMDTLRAFAEERFGVQTSSEQALRLLVPFLAAGMRAQSVLHDPQLASAQPRPRGKAALPARSVARPAPSDADD